MVEEMFGRSRGEFIAEKAVQTWNAGKLIFEDIYPDGVSANTRDEAYSPVIGTLYDPHFSVLSERTRDFLTTFDYSKDAVTGILNAYLYYDSYSGTSEAQVYPTLPYVLTSYLHRYSSDHEVEKDVVDVFSRNPQLQPFFEYAMNVHPLIGTVSASLYKRAFEQHDIPQTPIEKALSKKDRKTFREMYLHSVESVARTAEYIDSFFPTLSSLARTSFEKTTVTEFLAAVHWDVKLNLLESLGVLSGSVVNMDSADCGTLTSYLPVPVKAQEFEKRRQQILSLWDIQDPEGKRPPLFTRDGTYTLSLNKRLTPQDGFLAMPVYLTAVDQADFLMEYEQFWSQVNDGIHSKKKFSNQFVRSGDHSRIGLGNAASLLLRPRPQNHKEARFAIEGTGRFKGMGIRVDDERGRDSLAVDIGSVEFDQLFAFSKEMAEQDARGQGFFNYYDGLHTEGSLLEFLTLSNSQSSFDQAQKAAVILGLSMMANHSLDIRKGSYFSYHAREAVNQKKFHDAFPQIVDSIMDMVKRKRNS